MATAPAPDRRIARAAAGRRDAFDAMSCAAWGDQARRELRASGESSRRRDLAARDQLTAQELQIAQLAARGLSNRDIAQRLYLSHRTIGTHLYLAYPLNRPRHAYLAVCRNKPVQHGSRPWIGRQLATLSLSQSVKKISPRWRPRSTTRRAEGMASLVALAMVMASGIGCPAARAASSHVES